MEFTIPLGMPVTSGKPEKNRDVVVGAFSNRGVERRLPNRGFQAQDSPVFKHMETVPASYDRRRRSQTHARSQRDNRDNRDNRNNNTDSSHNHSSAPNSSSSNNNNKPERQASLGNNQQRKSSTEGLERGRANNEHGIASRAVGSAFPTRQSRPIVDGDGDAESKREEEPKTPGELAERPVRMHPFFSGDMDPLVDLMSKIDVHAVGIFSCSARETCLDVFELDRATNTSKKSLFMLLIGL